jgi:hypothetical protein
MVNFRDPIKYLEVSRYLKIVLHFDDQIRDNYLF